MTVWPRKSLAARNPWEAAQGQAWPEGLPDGRLYAGGGGTAPGLKIKLGENASHFACRRQEALVYLKMVRHGMHLGT